MTNDFNPTEWITTKEAAELAGYGDHRRGQGATWPCAVRFIML
jgi:hypothetical protein